MIKRKTNYIILILTIVLLFVTGCALSGVSKVYKYRTTGDDIVEDFYLEKTEYYSDKVVIYWNGTINNIDKYSFSDAFEIKGNTLVLKTDKPEDFTSFYMFYADFDYKFRYLDSDQYACICTVMDSEGGLHYSGSIDHYYTEEEKGKQKEQAQERENEQKELFEKLEGTWNSDDGEYFIVYKDDDYSIQYYVDEREGTETPIFFQDYLYVNENRIAISYIDGPFDACFEIILSEDGQSFEYNSKVFYKGL
ncbi:MAG: hypothetical protein ACI4EF_11660 [Coprococcus sp.]